MASVVVGVAGCCSVAYGFGKDIAGLVVGVVCAYAFCSVSSGLGGGQAVVLVDVLDG